MAQHGRYADGGRNERAVIKFVREELLWRGHVDTVAVPFDDGSRLIGPTILDVLVRHESQVDGEPAFWGSTP
ncbi:MAG: hypothetical protein JF606_29745 [Burkholderiales bacterium]|jgi:hypothetical protein|nr:hypothetical protein [Burkholderiales bacterium]